MRESPRIALIATLDTKGAEIDYVAERVVAFGGVPTVIDAGILGEPTGNAPDVTREDVARAGGHELEALRSIGTRGAAVEGMCRGVRAVFLDLWAAGKLDGALCLGGAEGALLGAAGMHALPVGVPKLIVSPSASGRRAFAPFVGETDTCVMHSVIDILGINPISRAVFDNAAAAVVGMATSAGEAVGRLGTGTIAITMLGQTTPGVMRLRDRLAEAGLDSVIFHANGVGGPAMERLLEQRAIGGVIDYTLSELANSVKDGIHAVGPERLTVAGRLGVPQIVVPGCVDFFNQGAPETVPRSTARGAATSTTASPRWSAPARTRCGRSRERSRHGCATRRDPCASSPRRAASRFRAVRARRCGTRRPTRCFSTSSRRHSALMRASSGWTTTSTRRRSPTGSPPPRSSCSARWFRGSRRVDAHAGTCKPL
jgi:uncharacterized protein (UPF0261 family)